MRDSPTFPKRNIAASSESTVLLWSGIVMYENHTIAKKTGGVSSGKHFTAVQCPSALIF
jgi:hypothetical protein